MGLPLYHTLREDDEARIQREGIVLDVVAGCGGRSAHAPDPRPVPVHDPRACRHPNCGQYRATRGNEHAFGRTPLIALSNLPALRG